MLDRASTFSDPEIVRLLQTEFVPVAIDQAYQRRQEDAEGRFYQKIANQGPRKVGDGTTQGRYVATADGTLLGYNNNLDTDRVLKLMRQALVEFAPKAVEVIEAGKPDRRFVYPAPDGGLVVRVNSRVLGGYEETDDKLKQIFQQGLGRDNFWIRKDEHEALVRGEVPESLLIRLAHGVVEEHDGDIVGIPLIVAVVEIEEPEDAVLIHKHVAGMGVKVDQTVGILCLR